MFGYVNVLKHDLKVRDYMMFRSYYCGLCRALKDSYGALGQLTLTYDMTFVIFRNLLAVLFDRSFSVSVISLSVK